MMCFCEIQSLDLALALSVTLIYYTGHFLLSKNLNVNHKGIFTPDSVTIGLFTSLLFLSGHPELHMKKNKVEGLMCGSYLILFTQLWIILFKLLNKFVKVHGLSKDQHLDLHNRIMGVIHGFITSSVSICIIGGSIFEFGNDSYIFNKEEIKLTRFIFIVSMTYFILHAYICQQFKIKGVWMHFHHTMAIATLFFGLSNEKEYYWVLQGLFMGQSSATLSQLRPLLILVGYKYTKLFTCIEKICIYYYILVRIFLSIIIYIIPCIFDSRMHIVKKILSISFFLFGLQIVYAMIVILIKRNIQEKQMKEKEIQYEWFRENKQLLSQLSFYQSRHIK